MEKNTKENQLLEDMIESQLAFADQFDPNSETHHKGNITLVPTGGSRVPVQMPTVYPTDLKNSKDEETQYGEEYDNLMIERQNLIELKKQLASFTKILEAMMRHKEIFQQKGKQDNEKHLETYNKNVQIEVERLETLKSTLMPMVAITETSEFKDRYAGLRQKPIFLNFERQMIEQAEGEFKNKQDLGEFFLNFNKYGKNSFADAQKMLERVKKIKKEVTDKQKKEQEQPNKQSEEQKVDTVMN